MYFPMEIVAVANMLDTVEMCSLAMIPSEAQVGQAISMLCKQQEREPNNFVYINFPLA